MANTSKINGFRPVKHTSGAPYNGQCNLYQVPSSDGTALFVGDPVKLSGSSDANGIATVIRATAGGPVLGVVVGIVPAKIDPVSGKMTGGSTALDTPQYRAASTDAFVLVCDSDDVIYEVEATTSGGASYSFAAADVGLNADAYLATGSTTTGASGCALNMTGAATTATLQFKILGTVQRVDNEPTGNATKVLAKINQATLGTGTGATGV